MGSCVFNKESQERIMQAYNEQFSKSLKSPTDAWKKIIKNIQKDKPSAPPTWKSNWNEWLSNWDINKVMKVYQKEVPDFIYIDTVPIDFDKKNKFGQCVVSEMCNLCLADLVAKGKYRIGIVLNTAPSTSDGEHWIAVFCDLRPGIERIVYFDSYSAKPEKEIRKLMLHWSNQWKAIAGHPLKAEYNSTRHQYKNSECGIYSIYFIHCCLFEVPMDHRIPDDTMMMIRDRLFKIK